MLMSRRTNILTNTDWLTVILYLLLVFFGWLNIFSVNYYDQQYTGIFDFDHRYGMQLIWIFIGFILAVFVFIIDSKFYSYFAYLLHGLIILSLVAVLIIGNQVHGARSWITIGGFNFQPSEFVKITTALAIARFLSHYSVKINQPRTILVLFGIILLPAALVMLQPDWGSSLVFFAFILVLFREGLPGWVLMLIAGIALLFLATLIYPKIYIIIVLIGLAGAGFYILKRRFAYLFIAALIFALAYAGIYLFNRYREAGLSSLSSLLLTLAFSSIIYFIIAVRKKIPQITFILLFLLTFIAFSYSVDYVFHNVLKPHQQTRVNILLGIESDPLGYGYNVNQSKIAIGSGGFGGKGFLQGTQTKFDFVPEQSTDFIFCTVGEEWGFLGAGLVVIIFSGLLIRLIFLAERQRSKFSRIYGYGVFSILFLHFFINIGMTVGLLPVIGIPLPFFSYGGSSFLAFTLLLFIFVKLDASRLSVLR